MKFSTPVSIKPDGLILDYKKKYFCMGSCFSDEVGKFLIDQKFTAHNNVLGICFNPISICNHLKLIIDHKEVSINELEKKEDYFVHFDFHGNFYDQESQALVMLLNEKLSSARKSLQDADVLLITLGTAFVFKHKDQNRIVNNCHKFPQDQFERILLKNEEIETELKNALSDLNRFNPKLKIIFTVSPIRHIRDGLVSNQRSKAQLISAVHNIIDTHQNCFYFPSYELLLDELRDYRFYKEDMIHPSAQAIQFILKRFLNQYFKDQDLEIVKKVEGIRKQINHKILKPESSQYHDFLIRLKANVKKVNEEHPFLDFEQEINQIEDSLKEFKNV